MNFELDLGKANSEIGVDAEHPCKISRKPDL